LTNRCLARDRPEKTVIDQVKDLAAFGERIPYFWDENREHLKSDITYSHKPNP